MKESHGNSCCLKDSQFHATIIKELAAGETCVIADIQFILKKKQTELESTFRAAAPDIEIKWVCFENDWIQCLKNVDRRAGSNTKKFVDDATEIVKLTRHHSIPADAEIRPVWRPA
jgi:hypothetical protein